jgi:UDP-glucose 4-epimerase
VLLLFLCFNPIGSHPSIEIEITAGVPQNLVPFMQTGMGLRRKLFTEMITNSWRHLHSRLYTYCRSGQNTCCFATTSKQKNADEVETFNLGTGTGSSVLEVIQVFEKVSGQNYLTRLSIEKVMLFRLMQYG